MKARLLFLAYTLVVVAANLVTASTMPAEIGPFLVTWGTWFIGATFILRDALQLAAGRGVAYLAILTALGASAVASYWLGDLLWITVGSAVAFAISETTDTEIFTRLKVRLSGRIAVSGLVGGTLDSVAFALIALSPWTTGIVPWSALPNVILGQIIVKGVLQLVAAAAVRVATPDPVPA